MSDLVFWLYFANSVLLIIHEIDSAYWKEWELFRLPGGLSGFLLIHFPLLMFVLYGLVLLVKENFAGLVFSLCLSLGGIFAFSIHTWFLQQGREEFSPLVSRIILASTLAVSVVQFTVTVYVMV
ncbi:MAG: hypothetical protein JRD68_10255 [Deltaproteobacteria bacterium]|nr:hypothetical protein [Deltaproteobacteria bacterium]